MDYTDRIKDDGDDCAGDCEVCTIYSICPYAGSEERADAPGEMYDDAGYRLYP